MNLAERLVWPLGPILRHSLNPQQTTADRSARYEGFWFLVVVAAPPCPALATARWQSRSRERPRQAYFPFGGSPRLCMGVDMAMMEMLLIMAMVVQRYRIHLVSGHREEPDCVLDMIPRYRVRATLHPQQPVGPPAAAPPVVAPGMEPEPKCQRIPGEIV